METGTAWRGSFDLDLLSMASLPDFKIFLSNKTTSDEVILELEMISSDPLVLKKRWKIFHKLDNSIWYVHLPHLAAQGRYAYATSPSRHL